MDGVEDEPDIKPGLFRLLDGVIQLTRSVDYALVEIVKENGQTMMVVTISRDGRPVRVFELKTKRLEIASTISLEEQIAPDHRHDI